MKFKAAVFDLDGTLIDTMGDIAHALGTALVRNGFAAPDPEECRNRVGWGLEQLVSSSLPEAVRNDMSRIRAITGDLKTEYRKDPVARTHPYSGIGDVLGTLTGMGLPLFVWTNKEQQLAETILKTLFPTVRFTAVLGDTPERPLKPDPAGAEVIRSRSSCDAAEVVYFGDSDVDMETAVRSGFHPVGVLWGYRSADELNRAGAARLIDSTEQIIAIIEGE